jgi:hypothetical protein
MEFTALPFGSSSALGPANVADAEALLRKACDGGEMLGCTSLGVLPIDLCINLPDEEGWCLGAVNQIETAMTTMAELVHDDETLENWTQMIEVTSMSSRSPVMEKLGGLDAFIQLTDDAAASTCEEGWDLKVVDEEPINGFTARVFVTRCERLSRTAHTHESVWGTSETKVQLLIEGRQNLYNVIRTKRGSDLDERSVNEWIAFLKNVRLCDTPIPVQLCKSYESGTNRTGDAPSAIGVAGFESAFSQEGFARWSEESQSQEFRGAIERGDLEGFCQSFGKLMDAIYHEPWRLAAVNPTAPHRGCAVISRSPDISFMCCPCKYPGAVHKVCTS